MAGILTVKGGTGAIVEYFGPGAETISATGKATICNMGAEIGATCSLFPYDEQTAKYLKATGREAIADLADQYADHLRNDPEVDADPERFYDRVIEIDLSTLEPHLVGPHTPDLDRPISRDRRRSRRARATRVEISAALVGSCTNSSYEDIGRAAHIARQASGEGQTGEGAAHDHARFGAGARHDRARRAARRPRGDRRDRARERLRPVHRPVEARDVAPEGPNTIVTSFNRNFPARNDGNARHARVHRVAGDGGRAWR